MEIFMKRLLKIFLVLVIIIALIGIGGLVFLNSMLGKIGRTDTVSSERISESQLTEDADYDATLEDSIVIDADVDTASGVINSETWGHGTIVPMKNKDVTNILLIGQDRREGEGRQRSDSMILVSINKNSEVISMTSIMRDMYVPITGYSANRINVPYVLGGMELLDQVIEENFGIIVDYNVEVDFDGFITAFTEIGDLDISLTADEASHLNSTYGWYLSEGVNTLNSEQLLAYCRVRSVGKSDWGRTARQRKVLMTAFAKLKNESPLTLVSMANNIFPYLTTDMSNSQIIGCVYDVIVGGISTTKNYRIPVDGAYSAESIDGRSVLVPDLAANSKAFQYFIYGESSSVSDFDVTSADTGSVTLNEETGTQTEE